MPHCSKLGSTQVCYDCRQVKSVESFTLHVIAGEPFRNRRCNPCRSCRSKSSRLENEKREQVMNAKRKPCTDCGGVFDPVCMEFDHMPDKPKCFGISGNWRWKSLDATAAEIEKCEVVCANCHRLRTFKKRAFKGGRPLRAPTLADSSPIAAAATSEEPVSTVKERSA